MSKAKDKAFQLIQDGANEEKLMQEMQITRAAAERYVESYRNEKQNGEIRIVTDSAKRFFELFDKGLSNDEVRTETGISINAIKGYRTKWIEYNKPDIDTELAAAVLAGEITWEQAILNLKGVVKVEKVKKHFEPRNSVGEVEQKAEIKEEVKENDSEKIIETAIADIQEKECKYEYREMPNGLKKKVKIVEIPESIEGEFATYTPSSNGLYDIEIDGQVITINCDQMKVLGKELIAVSDEEI